MQLITIVHELIRTIVRHDTPKVKTN